MSKVKVTVLHNVSASKERYIPLMDTLNEFKLCANYQTAEHMTHVKVIRSINQIAITLPRIDFAQI